MSWQAYVDQQLLATGVFKHAAIVGKAGGVWATSPGFTVSEPEIKEIATGISDPSGLQASGIHVNGSKHMFLGRDLENNKPTSLRGQSSKTGTGLAIADSTQAIIIGEYESAVPGQAGKAANAVYKLAEYLRSVNY